MVKNDNKRAPREAPPPSTWIRSRSGTVARITRVSRRDDAGAKLYRLWFPSDNVRGHQEWTLSDLLAAGVRFLKRCPRGVESKS